MVGLSYRVFIVLRLVPFNLTLSRTFITKACWVLSQAFFASIEIIQAYEPQQGPAWQDICKGVTSDTHMLVVITSLIGLKAHSTGGKLCLVIEI